MVIDDDIIKKVFYPIFCACINELPDPDLNSNWRPARSNSKNKSAIYDIPLSHEARMFFKSFDIDAALRVWGLADTLRYRWETNI